MIPPPFDAWVLAKLMANQPVDAAELDATSEPWRSIAEHLEALPEDDLDRIIKAHLPGEPNVDAVIRAIEDQAPRGPAPPIKASDRAAPRMSSVRLTCAAEITAKPIEWLWRGRVPMGMLTLFAGDPKLGKSYVTLTMAAAVSRGAPMPDSDPPDGPGSVILMSAEDDPARVIVPRLVAAGGTFGRSTSSRV